MYTVHRILTVNCTLFSVHRVYSTVYLAFQLQEGQWLRLELKDLLGIPGFSCDDLCTALHFTTLYCTALHCTALQCTALHLTPEQCCHGLIRWHCARGEVSWEGLISTTLGGNITSTRVAELNMFASTCSSNFSSNGFSKHRPSGPMLSISQN